MITQRNRFCIEDFNIILVEDLFDDKQNWYDLTLKSAVDEQTRGKPLISCEYSFLTDEYGDRILKTFLAYTEDRVIFMLLGIGLKDTLLYSVKRFPSSIK